MKKLLLSVVFAMVALTTTFAANLNPFAYGLKSTYDPLSLTLSGEFMLNAPATSVTVYAIDADGRKYLLRSYGAVKAKGKIAFEYDLMALRIPQGVDLNWCVEVTGEAVTSVTFVDNANRLYAPTSVDIDNNPENANFGTVFCVEGLNGAYQTSGYTSYISYTDGAGLYLLNADGTARKMPYQGSNVRYGYNGAVVNQPDRDRPFFGKNTEYDLKGYKAFRVRVSDDGRIFVTSFSTNGHVLWEAKKECFSATTEDEWSANTGWHKIMANGNANTVMATEKRNCTHDYCGIYSLYQGNASTGTYIAGPNMGFDVRGSGDNLQLLMLGGCKQAIVWSTPGHYYCDEYDLGQATLWNTPPSRRIFAGHSDGVDIVNPQGVQVQYDKSGNVWLAQHRAVTTNTTLARVNRSLASTKKNNVEIGQIDHNESSHTFRRCGAIRFNEDFSQVAIASNANGNGGGFTVYPVDASTGMPIWAQGTEVNTYNKTGVSLMDFAWDYAGNLYIAADASTNGERIAVYAMPHAADRVVSTPAASKYSFKIDCDRNVTYLVKATCSASEGSIVCTPAAYAGVVGNGAAVPSCTELTLTVTPDAAHKFTGWKDQETGKILSTDKVFTISVTRNLTLTATFEYAEYHNITWWNLFKDGEDIYDETIDVQRNARLYYLFMAYYNAGSGAGKRWAQKMKDGSNEYDLVNSCYTYADELLNKNEESPMYWLGEYLKSVVSNSYTLQVGDNETYSVRWGQTMYAFINRVGYAKNPYADNYPKYTTPQELMNAIKAFASISNGGTDAAIYTKWRPYWTEIACKLPSTLTYDKHLPTMNVWNRIPGPYNEYDTYENNVVPGNIQPEKTPKWYQWYVPENVPELKGLSHPILAWRHNSPTGEIVHHVWKDNMKLYASYVRKHIEESDPPAKPENYDAKNEDIIKLMANPNWDPADRVATHNLTVTRKLVKGVYNTICLPFDVELNGLMDGHPLKGATLLSFSSIDDNLYNQSGEPVTVLNFTEVPEVTIGGKPCRILQAGIPYLIKVHKDVDEAELLKEMRFTGIGRDVLILNAYSSETYRGVTFHGTINPTNIPEGSLILVADNRLALTTETGQMLGLRGYFTIDPMMASDIAEQAADGRVYLSIQKPTTTSIPVAPEAEQPKQPKVRKVMHNGQIYILRGDEVYTITGHRVK